MNEISTLVGPIAILWISSLKYYNSSLLTKWSST